MKKYLAVLGSSLVGLMLSTVTYAANPEPAVVQVEFVAPISITKTLDLDFGLVDVAMLVGETIAIDVNNVVTDSDANIVGGLPRSAATFDVLLPVSKSITISVTTPLAGTHYTLGAWTCDYIGASVGDCITGISVTSGAGTQEVRVGVTLTGLGTAVETTDPGTFDLTIVYN